MQIAFDHQIFCLQNYGGISRYFVRMAENMLESGHDPVFFALLHRNNYLKSLPQSAVSGRWVERYWPRTTRAILAYNYFMGRQGMRKWRPDVVHETYYSRFSSGPKSCPRVLTVYDMIHELFPDSFSARDNTTQLKRIAVERADHVICISESTRRDLMSFFSVPASKVSVVHLGFEHFTTQSSGPNLARPYLLYVGSRHGYKNFSGLLQSVASSARLKRDFDIVAFGGGGFSDAERQSIRELGYAADQVRQISGDDAVLGGLYDAARAFIYPSMYEGFGLPPLEAMRHSCPVISSGTSSMPEVIGDAGVLFDPSDSEDMAGAIERVVYSESEIAELVRRGRERLNHFSWQRCTQETLSIYQSLQR